MNAHIGEEVNRIILAPGKESINTKVQFHIQDAFAQLEASMLFLLVILGEKLTSLQ